MNFLLESFMPWICSYNNNIMNIILRSTQNSYFTSCRWTKDGRYLMGLSRYIVFVFFAFALLLVFLLIISSMISTMFMLHSWLYIVLDSCYVVHLLRLWYKTSWTLPMIFHRYFIVLFIYNRQNMSSEYFLKLCSRYSCYRNIFDAWKMEKINIFSLLIFSPYKVNFEHILNNLKS